MKLFWIVHKDLVSEYRSWQVWPAMLVLALVVSFFLVLQSESTSPDGFPNTAQQIWLATYFAGILVLHRSFEAEQEDDCWGALLLYPVSPATIFAGKLLGNVMAIGAVQGVLVLFFGLVEGTPFLRSPWKVLVVLFLGNLAMVSIGTVVASLSAAARHGQGLVAVIVLPLVLPLLLVASETTRLSLDGSGEQTWWEGIMLLTTFAVAFCSIGFAASGLLFEE